jgi:IAA-amino acid hydrolase
MGFLRCLRLLALSGGAYAAGSWVDVKLNPQELGAPQAPSYSELFQAAFDVLPWVMDIRRQLHQHPELMFAEAQTSETIAAALTKLEISFTQGWAVNTKHAQLSEKGFESGPGGTGIVAELGTGKPPCVLLRADIDALPIQEDPKLVPFESEEKGKMHACGHDAHAAMLLGAAAVLKGHDQLGNINGTIRMIWQPAEEGGAGGKRMVEEGVLSKAPPVQAAFGFHQWPFLPLGVIGGRPGTLMAATELFDITVHGRGGHAAMPHLALDPIVAASHVVTQLQSIAARETSPLDAAVVSVTKFRAGDAYNVIPDGASIGGTLRSLTLDGLQRLRDRVATVVDSVTSAHQCNASISWSADACKITSCTILCSLMPPTTKLIFFSTHLTFCYLFSVCFTFRPTDG